jgi:hypothetical protein
MLGNSEEFPSIKKVLRTGSHCGGEELCRESDPPQAENLASEILSCVSFGRRTLQNSILLLYWKY